MSTDQSGKDDDVKSVRDIPYIRYLAKSLATLGAWPQDPALRPPGEPSEPDDGPSPWEPHLQRPPPEKVCGGTWRRALRWYLVVQGCVSFAGCVGFVRARSSELSPLALGHVLLTALLNGVHISRCVFVLSASYYRLVDEYLYCMHLHLHRQRSDYFRQVASGTQARCWALGLLTVLVFAVGVPLYNLRPVLSNLASGAYRGEAELHYSVYYQIPGVDLRHSLGPYAVVSLMNVGVSCFCVSSIWLPDLLAMQVVLHIGGHIDILSHQMKSFGEEMVKGLLGRLLFNDEETAIVDAKLKYFVNYHRQILRFVRMTNDAFGTVYLVYFTYFQVALCIMMWECSQGSQGLLQYGMLTSASVLSLCLLCTVLEMIGTKSELLEREVYLLPWQHMGVRSRGFVASLLRRAQAPLRMKVVGDTDVGVATMAAILKTSISYFMLLRSLE